MCQNCIYQNESWNKWIPGTVIYFPKTCLGAEAARWQVGTCSSHYFLPAQFFAGFQSEHPVWRERAGNPGQPLFWRRWYHSFSVEGVHSTSLQLLGGSQSTELWKEACKAWLSPRPERPTSLTIITWGLGCLAFAFLPVLLSLFISDFPFCSLMQEIQPTDITQRGTTMSFVLCNAWNYSIRQKR